MFTPKPCRGCKYAGKVTVEVTGMKTELFLCEARQWSLRHWNAILAGEECKKRVDA